MSRQELSLMLLAMAREVGYDEFVFDRTNWREFISHAVSKGGWKLPATRGYVVNISPGHAVVQLGDGSLDLFKITKK